MVLSFAYKQKTIPLIVDHVLPFCFSGDLQSGKKLHTIAGGRKGTEDRHVGHTAHVLCMSISSDGKYLVSCGARYRHFNQLLTPVTVQLVICDIM